MDVRLPNGTTIKNVPDHYRQTDIMALSIKHKLAVPEDFPEMNARANAPSYQMAKDTPEGDVMDTIMGVGKSALAGLASIPATALGLGAKITYGRVGMYNQGREAQRTIEESLSPTLEPSTAREAAAEHAVSAAMSAPGRLAGKVSPYAQEFVDDALKAAAVAAPLARVARPSVAIGPQSGVAGNPLSAVPKAPAQLSREAAHMAIDDAVITAQRAAEKRLKPEINYNYDKVKEHIGRKTQVSTPAAKTYINDKLAEASGDKTRLTMLDKKVYDLVYGAVPRYGHLDNLRKRVGAAKKGKDQEFGNTASAELDQIYKVLGDDQMTNAKAFGAGDYLQKAQDLTVERKGIQDQIKQNYGKGGSILPKVKAAAKDVVDGRMDRYTKLVNSTPTGLRQALDEAIAMQIKANGAVGPRMWETLRHNKAAAGLATLLVEGGAHAVGLPPMLSTSVAAGATALRMRSAAKLKKGSAAERMKRVKKQ